MCDYLGAIYYVENQGCRKTRYQNILKTGLNVMLKENQVVNIWRDRCTLFPKLVYLVEFQKILFQKRFGTCYHFWKPCDGGPFGDKPLIGIHSWFSDLKHFNNTITEKEM